MMDNKSYLKNITHLKFLISNVVSISLQTNVIFNLFVLVKMIMFSHVTLNIPDRGSSGALFLG
jgi:hypothetical protein